LSEIKKDFKTKPKPKNKMISKITLILFCVLMFLKGFGQDLPLVTFQTDFGKIVCEIDTVKAPITALNFLNHVKNDTYKNAVFYRVVRLDNQPNNDVKIEVIQGGVFTDVRFEKIEAIEHETTEQTGINI